MTAGEASRYEYGKPRRHMRDLLPEFYLSVGAAACVMGYCVGGCPHGRFLSASLRDALLGYGVEPAC